MLKQNRVLQFISQLGPLRVMLAVAAIAGILFATAPGTAAVYAGWEMVSTVLVPVLVPVVFMVLLLDTLMSAVFLTDKHGAERTRFKRIIILNLVFAALILVRWFPYYRALGE